MEAKIYQQELWNPDDLLEGAGTKKAVGTYVIRVTGCVLFCIRSKQSVGLLHKLATSVRNY